MKLGIAHYAPVLALSLVIAAGSAKAQEAPQPEAPVVEASTNCFSTFNIGTMIYCVSEHGNVARLTAPAVGPEHIRIGVIREGYAVCGAVGALLPPQIAHDAGNTEAGWQLPVTIVQPVPNSLPLTITRRTLTGLELVQSFAHNAAEREIVVTMTLRNISGATRFNVRLDRYFDGDIAADAGDDRYNRSADAVWGEDGGHAVMLSDINFPAVPHATAVHTFAGFNAATCGQATNATPTAIGDHVGRLSYSFGNLLNGASRTVRVQYQKL
jgi:hypothetical protein